MVNSLEWDPGCGHGYWVYLCTVGKATRADLFRMGE